MTNNKCKHNHKIFGELYQAKDFLIKKVSNKGAKFQNVLLSKYLYLIYKSYEN